MEKTQIKKVWSETDDEWCKTRGRPCEFIEDNPPHINYENLNSYLHDEGESGLDLISLIGTHHISPSPRKKFGFKRNLASHPLKNAAATAEYARRSLMCFPKKGT